MKPWACAGVLIFVAVASHADPAAKPPHGARHISIDYTWQSFSRDERHYKLDWNGTRYISDKKQPIDAKLVDALYGSLATTRETAEELRCMSHTDDYPAFVVTIDGDEPVTITSRSNCHAYVPWNVKRAGKLYVQFTGDAWTGLAPILAALDGKWQGNQPEATMSYGGEMVGLGEYDASGRAFGEPGDAGTCAHSFEINPQARHLFGDALKVDKLMLACDLGDSKNCSSDLAEAQFVMSGITMQIDFACANGVASIPPKAAKEYAELQRFTSSKVVRAVVKVSGTYPTRPRLWNNGAWNLEAATAGVPLLGWDPKGNVIEARAYGTATPNAAFWSELGIDPKPLVKMRDGTPVIDVKLDFAGRIVK